MKSKLSKIALTAALTLALIFINLSCSGENGIDGKDGESVNVDSLTNVIRGEIANQLWDSLQNQRFIDSIYDALYNDAFSQSWLDSSRAALLDSIKGSAKDSLYDALYDEVYADLSARDVQRNVFAYTYYVKDAFNGAFANQYRLMYKNYVNSNSGKPLPVPVAVSLQNSGKQWYNVSIKAWIDGFSDTSSVQILLNPSKDTIAGPKITFNQQKLLALAAPAQASLQIRAYALAYGKEVPLLSDSRVVEIHPMQIYGAELVNIFPENRYMWRSVFVTPNMDSIQNLHNSISAKLKTLGGSGSILGYQQGNFGSIANAVDAQVRAAYEVLSEKGILYVNNSNAGSMGQKIKYPIEVLRSKNANCIEGAQLFAAILESMSLQPAIVEIPGHAFLAWRTSKAGSVYDFLETTVAWGEHPSTYSYAKTSGASTFDEHFDVNYTPLDESTIVDIYDARKLGIMPNDIP
jgi:hypothetical protein